MNKITPKTGYHFKSKKTGDVYEASLYLGIYDSADNYVEITEEEYRTELKRIEERNNSNIGEQKHEY